MSGGRLELQVARRSKEGDEIIVEGGREAMAAWGLGYNAVLAVATVLDVVWKRARTATKAGCVVMRVGEVLKVVMGRKSGV